MLNFKQQFIELAYETSALSFGKFELKSGRISPFFFNAGKFNSGAALARLGQCYADKIIEMDIEFDLLFGPAYKGIPLVAATAAALYTQHGLDIPYTFNRKEPKAHGEGGSLVGAALEGKVLILDDVITAGTAIRQSLSLIRQHANAEAIAVLVGLDRQEKGEDELSAIQALAVNESLQVEAIVQLNDLIDYLSNKPSMVSTGAQNNLLESLKDYRLKYGVA